MASNINQIKATIEANLATIRDAYYAALNSDSSPEGVATARANYATALKSVQLNALTLIDDQIKPDIVDLGGWNIIAKIGMANPSILLAEEVTESKGGEVTNQMCIDLLNRYLKALKELLDNTGGVAVAPLLGLFQMVQGLPNDGLLVMDTPIDCWLACEIIEALKKEGNYKDGDMKKDGEGCRDYVLRKKYYLDVAEQRPDIFRLPSFPFELTPGWWGSHRPPFKPEMFDEFEKKILEYIRQMQTNPSGTPPSPKCAELYKEMIDWFIPKAKKALKIVNICQELNNAFKALMQSGCFQRLQLSVVFARRKIGRFDDIDEFIIWFKEWFFGFHPFGIGGPDLEPAKSFLSMEEYEDLQRAVAFKDRPDRYEVAFRKCEEWERSSEFTRSAVPPIWKDLFSMFDNSEFTDEFVMNYFLGTVLRGDYANHVKYRWSIENFQILHEALTDLLNSYVEGDV